MPYSNSGGGALTLSPSSPHHGGDFTSAVRSLRHSLSRSPSKFGLVSKSPSPSAKAPSPCQISPRRSSSQPATLITGTSNNPPHTPSPLVPFPPSKLALRSSARSKTAPPRALSRTRTSPRSPMKRALSQASDSGNIHSITSASSATGQENCTSTSPSERKSFERNSKMPFNSELNAPVNHMLSRLGGDGSNDSPITSSTSSPLKRSDAIMNLDQASLGSPVAKRRSLHGSASFGHDFNVFDHGPSSSTPSFEIHDDSSHEYELSAASLTAENPLASFTSMPRRSSSLRKSTLQQRHGEKTSWGRRHAAQVLAVQQASSSTVTDLSPPNPTKNRPRLSLDQFMPPMARESPFSSQGNLPNASMHMVSNPAHQPHPLSRTMTTSSSSSSIVDESPTHVPTHFGEQPRPKLDFSKSLPAGSLRPITLEGPSDESSGSFSTPRNYKSVKPLPAAFMSTGLISKVNRNPEEQPISRGVSKGNVPDTPCKKQVNGFATYPAQVPGSAIARARHIRHSFGTPSTPFNPHGSQSSVGTFGKGTGVFGSAFGNGGLTRRGSFLSADGDEANGSPDPKGDSQSSTDLDLPPTPTKQALVSGLLYPYQHHGSPSSHRNLATSASANGPGLAKKISRTNSKLNLSTSSGNREDEEGDASIAMNVFTTTASFRHTVKSSLSVPSCSRSHSLHGPQPPSLVSLILKSVTTSFLTTTRKLGFAKISYLAPASPLERIDFSERLSPRTPQESMLPPDPSGLSISNLRDTQAAKASMNGASMPPPATPTAGRDYFSKIGDRRLSTTPISTFAPSESDESLTSRFEKVEIIGAGEFSQVYRVTQTSIPQNVLQSFYFGNSTSPSQGLLSPTPLLERLFAVKKSRQPYQGIRDRQRKLQEISVLKALGHSDHVVHFIDSWEDKNHLYIQTEYCEEGSLDLFLSDVGRRGRLDDFRIWKIMLELSQVDSPNHSLTSQY